MSTNIVDTEFKFLQEDNALIKHQGGFTSDIVDKLLRGIKSDLQNNNQHIRTLKVVYHICVECLENIVRHGKELVIEGERIKWGNFYYVHRDDHIGIHIENFLSEEDKNALESKLNGIAHLSIEEIKEKYKYDLRHGEISDRGGAGLGIYVMAMKSEKKYAYHFSKHDKDVFMYTLRIVIGSKTSQ